MNPHQPLVALEGYGLDAAPHRIIEPPSKVLADRLIIRVKTESTVAVGHSLGELLRYFHSRLAVQHLTLRPCGGLGCVPRFPATVPAAANRSLVVAASFSHYALLSSAPWVLRPKLPPACVWSRAERACGRSRACLWCRRLPP